MFQFLKLTNLNDLKKLRFIVALTSIVLIAQNTIMPNLIPTDLVIFTSELIAIIGLVTWVALGIFLLILSQKKYQEKYLDDELSTRNQFKSGYLSLRMTQIVILGLGVCLRFIPFDIIVTTQIAILFTIVTDAIENGLYLLFERTV